MANESPAEKTVELFRGLNYNQDITFKGSCFTGPGISKALKL